MTSEELFTTLRARFIEVLNENGIEKEPVEVICRSLSPEEAIGIPREAGLSYSDRKRCYGSGGVPRLPRSGFY